MRAPLADRVRRRCVPRHVLMREVVRCLLMWRKAEGRRQVASHVLHVQQRRLLVAAGNLLAVLRRHLLLVDPRVEGRVDRELAFEPAVVVLVLRRRLQRGVAGRGEMRRRRCSSVGGETAHLELADAHVAQVGRRGKPGRVLHGLCLRHVSLGQSIESLLWCHRPVRWSRRSRSGQLLLCLHIRLRSVKKR